MNFVQGGRAFFVKIGFGINNFSFHRFIFLSERIINEVKIVGEDDKGVSGEFI